nr:hypothetical protein [Hylemonella gracilis]
MPRQHHQGGRFGDQPISQHAIPLAAKLVHRHRHFEFAGLPAREIACRHTIAQLQRRHASAQRHDFARPVRERNDTALSGKRVALLQDQQIAVVERARMDFDKHLIGPWLRHSLFVLD